MANSKKTVMLGTACTLKVYERTMCRQSRYRHVTAHCPEIRLLGKWLQQCGFRIGQHIEVKQEQHKLIITPAWCEEMD